MQIQLERATQYCAKIIRHEDNRHLITFEFPLLGSMDVDILQMGKESPYGFSYITAPKPAYDKLNITRQNVPNGDIPFVAVKCGAATSTLVNTGEVFPGTNEPKYIRVWSDVPEESIYIILFAFKDDFLKRLSEEGLDYGSYLKS